MNNDTQSNEQIKNEAEITDVSKPCANLTENNIIPRTFSRIESIFAWLSLLAGYIFCRVFPASANPLGAVIFIISLFIATIIILKVKKIKLSTLPLAASSSAIIISLIMILSGNDFLNFFAYSYALIVYFYFIYSSTGNCLQKGFSNFIIVDFIRALFVLPFYSIGYMFKALFSSQSGKKFTLKILVGLGVAIIPTAIVLSLLSYDSSFLNLWDSIFQINIAKIFSHLASLILGIPIGMYIFGSFLSSVDNKCSDILTVAACKETSEKIKRIPILTSVFATVPVLFVYVIFFISQWQYYISGFTGKLPENLSYAQYAREGFFQLCAVSVINLVLILTVMLVMNRTDVKSSVVLKLLTLVFSAFTLILISTALAKMVMYINFYGLTQKRIYSTWLMVVLAMIFIFIAAQQLAPKIKTVALSFTVVVVLFAALALSNVNGIIAKYNVNHYISGDLKTVDVASLTDLGDAAVPELVNLYEYIGEGVKAGKITQTDFSVYSELKKELSNIEKEYNKTEKNIFSFTLPRYRAEKAIKNWKK